MVLVNISALVAAYVAVAVLLLSLNLTSHWVWWIKAGAIALTSGFFVASYVTIVSLLGWPTSSRPPERFNLLWSKVVDPDKKTGAPGSIYLWAEELDSANLPAGPPRAYELPYDEDLARRIAEAQKQREEGEEIMGTIDAAEAEEMAEAETKKLGGRDDQAEATSRTDTVPFREQDIRISFEELPPVDLPDKGPL